MSIQSIIPIFAALALCACSTTREVATTEQRNEREAYAWRLLYAQAPEFRSVALDLYQSGWSSSRTVKRPQDADLFHARWRYTKDGTESYRFIELQRDRTKAGKHDEVTLTTGRERATNIIEQHPYAPKPTPGNA